MGYGVWGMRYAVCGMGYAVIPPTSNQNRAQRAHRGKAEVNQQPATDHNTKQKVRVQQCIRTLLFFIY